VQNFLHHFIPGLFSWRIYEQVAAIEVNSIAYDSPLISQRE